MKEDISLVPELGFISTMKYGMKMHVVRLSRGFDEEWAVEDTMQEFDDRVCGSGRSEVVLKPQKTSENISSYCWDV
ncbi:hypothetical protein SADUNF_Sadunf13G0062400 [Salix dunnii]|uniref:Uncharacterized protein n=1 Tax=Salix dunnii TaxID=1413687 RepID=A0A835JJF2_9ROSI|nr:hypothetical protein SADUNF_Sadunf13G0062400 [Salix dunnii]